MTELNDRDIRPILFDKYEAENCKQRIMEEFVLGKCRADAILVTTDEIIGFEIKSDKDSLVRLERQVAFYNKFCDKNHIVTGTRYLEKVKSEVPEYWGIDHVYVDDATGKSIIEEVREAIPNPKSPKVKLSNQMKFLWREELIHILKKYSIRAISKPKKEMVKVLKDKLEPATLKEELCETLIQRDYSKYN